MVLERPATAAVPSAFSSPPIPPAIAAAAIPAAFSAARGGPPSEADSLTESLTKR